MVSRRSFIVSGVPALTAFSFLGCRQQPDRKAGKQAYQSSRIMAVKRGEPAKADDRPSIYFEWPHDVGRGDCTIHQGARFQLYSDGNNHWECDISSTDTGDEADVSIYLFDSSFDPNSNLNVPLAIVGNYHFDIHDANSIKHWSQDYGPNAIFYNVGHIGPLELLQQAKWADMACGC